MTGFIEVKRHNAPMLISLNAIATVNPYDNETSKIVLLVTDRDAAEAFLVDNSYEDIVKRIEEAS